MRRSLALGLALVILGSSLHGEGRAQSGGAAGGAGRGQGVASKDGVLKPYNPGERRTPGARRPAYSRQPASAPAPDKRSRAAVFAKGVRDYYPAARANQSKNSNVVDPRSLCVPGRRALLQR